MTTHVVVRRGGILAAVVACTVLLEAGAAMAAAGDGSAYGVDVDVTLVGSPAVHIGPLAASNTNGPTTNTLATVTAPGILTTGVITTSATRDTTTGAVTAKASTANVGLPLLNIPLGTVKAQAIEADCTATQQGVTGSSTFLNATLGSLGAVAATPAPNTTLAVNVATVHIATIILNEQIHNPDGSLTVNALHVKLLGGVLGSLGSGDVIVSSVTCGPAGLPVPLASGAGMWIAFGLLGAFAVPVGVGVVRRRSATSV